MTAFPRIAFAPRELGTIAALLKSEIRDSQAILDSTADVMSPAQRAEIVGLRDDCLAALARIPGGGDA